jgi:hypothetical protein
MTAHYHLPEKGNRPTLPEAEERREIKRAVLHWLTCPPELGTVYRVFIGSPLQLQDFLMRVVGLDAKYVTIRDVRCSATATNAAQYTMILTHVEWNSYVQRSAILRESWLDML